VRQLATLGACMLGLACSVQATTDFAGDAGADSHASTGGFPGKENCENGVDDDSDELLDCADDECSTYGCAAHVPEDWNGPVALYMGTEPPPDCSTSGGFPDFVSDGGLLDTPAQTCPACSCDPAGVSCLPSVQTFGGPGCAGLLLDQFGNTCVNFDAPSTQVSFKLFTNPPSGGCAPISDAPTIPPPTVTEKARVCRRPLGAKDGGGCFADACVPKPEAPFTLCIYRNDPAPCPAGYETQQTIVTKFEDQRGCAPCACATDCTATAVGYDFCGAATPLGSASVNDQCVDLSAGQNSLGMQMTGAPTCAASGGEPTGSVVLTTLTLCCKP
jgi:hypothetical protein